MLAANEPPSAGGIDHHRPDVLRVEEGHEVDRAGLGVSV
jgi:hypothetical protein